MCVETEASEGNGCRFAPCCTQRNTLYLILTDLFSRKPLMNTGKIGTLGKKNDYEKELDNLWGYFRDLLPFYRYDRDILWVWKSF